MRLRLKTLKEIFSLPSRMYSAALGERDICPRAYGGCPQARDAKTFGEICSNSRRYVYCASLPTQRRTA